MSRQRRASAPRSGPARPDRSRPAVGRRGAAGGAGNGPIKRTRAPQPHRLTGRAAVLALVLVGLLLAYAYPVRVYLAQQAEIAGLESQQSEQRRKIDALAEQRAKWDDPEYVRSQARRRLQYVLPGETLHVVIDSSAAPAVPADAPTDQPKDSRPWYGKLWASIEAADQQ